MVCAKEKQEQEKGKYNESHFTLLLLFTLDNAIKKKKSFSILESSPCSTYKIELI